MSCFIPFKALLRADNSRRGAALIHPDLEDHRGNHKPPLLKKTCLMIKKTHEMISLKLSKSMFDHFFSIKLSDSGCLIH